DADPGPAGDDEVPELVDQDQDAEDDDKGEHRRHHYYPLDRAAIERRTPSRVSASIATHSSIDSSGVPAWRASARSISSGISVNPMRRSRNAPTATSLAAFRTTGAAPPSASAARASPRHGNLSSSGS